MKLKISRALAVTAGIAAATFGLAANASAAPAGTNVLNPTSGNEATAFSLTPPSGAACSGAGTSGYRWSAFIVSANVDPSTLTYIGSGPTGNAAGTYASPLYDTVGNPITLKNPAAAPLGLISGIPSFNFTTNLGGTNFGNGAYTIGFACTLAGAVEAGHYWTTPVTFSSVTAAGLTYNFGAVPAAPVLGALTPNNGSLAGSFTAAASTPAQSGYTVTAVPTVGATVTLPVAAPGAFTLTGLTNGVSYAVSVTATNSVGTSAPSNTVTATPAPAAYAAPTLSAASAVGSVVLSWTAPVGDSGRTGYTISGSFPGSPVTVAAGAVTTTISGLTAGPSFSFTIVATYPVPFSGTPSNTVSAVAFPNSLIVQDISVNRPVGALVMTQRCGVNGPLPDASDNVFGSLPALTSTATGPTPNPYGFNPGGTAPTLGLGGSADPLFSQYPYPVDAAGVPNPNYPTDCGINLGIGKLITSGPRAGQYFTAAGRINQVTIVDTRDANTNWTVNGTMSNFVNGSDSFSGDYLGWVPSKTDDSTATLAGYDQTVTAGPAVSPWSVATLNTANGLGSSKVLASAPAGAGLGIATLDARLKLLIPLTAKNGTFTGTLTFTAI
jgi:hypothetical protein